MLRLEAVAKSFAGRILFRDLSLRAAPGSLTLVSGPNGSGKSTLLLLMAGLLSPGSGRVVYSGREGGIGYLGHETQLYPGLTALENLGFWCRMYRRAHDEQRLLDALDSMGLLVHADTPARVFSRGMAQRLALARLLLLEPDLALLDEPLSGLDRQSEDNARTILHGLRDRGTALVWVSHDPERDRQGADAVLDLCAVASFAGRTEPVRDGLSC